MSFVERQIDLGGQGKIIKEINEIRDSLEKKSSEIEELTSRLNKLERKVGYGRDKIEEKPVSKRREDKESGPNIVGVMLLDNDEDDIFYNLLLMFSETKGQIIKVEEEKLLELCDKVEDMDIGEILSLDGYGVGEGIMCEKDQDGDWVMQS